MHILLSKIQIFRVIWGKLDFCHTGGTMGLILAFAQESLLVGFEQVLGMPGVELRSN